MKEEEKKEERLEERVLPRIHRFVIATNWLRRGFQNPLSFIYKKLVENFVGRQFNNDRKRGIRGEFFLSNKISSSQILIWILVAKFHIRYFENCQLN